MIKSLFLFLYVNPLYLFVQNKHLKNVFNLLVGSD